MEMLIYVIMLIFVGISVSDEIDFLYHCDDGFLCDKIICIPTNWRCDGNDDCLDRSDETNCAVNSCPIMEGYFMCTNGECLQPEKICNGVPDCLDGLDENDCNITCNNTNCSYKCLHTINGPVCYCPQGWQLDTDNETCIDVNECLIEGYCSQICHNHEGGVTCDCIKGYQLQRNHSCIATGAEPLILINDFRSIRGYGLRSNLNFSIYEHKSMIYCITYDMIEDRVYWTDHVANPSIYSITLQGTDIRTIISSGLITVENIEIDWLARNIYITDSGVKALIVCKLDGSICRSIVENIENIKALALDPPSGTMYWTCEGAKASIFKQGMDGSEKYPFVTKNLKWPKELALDVVMRQLYWIDACISVIERINLDGTGRKEIMKDSNFKPYSLSVFEDKLYWNDWHRLTPFSCNKSTGNNFRMILEHEYPVRSIHIFHPNLYEKESPNPCRHSGCSHLCLLSPKGRYSCVCPLSFILKLDNRTCIHLSNETYINDCPKDYCHNGGSCLVINNTKSCRCMENFGGELCEIKLDSLYLEKQFHSSTIWIVVVLIIIIILIIAIGIFLYYYLKKDSKLGRQSRNLIVIFRKSIFNSKTDESNLVLETDQNDYLSGPLLQENVHNER